MKNINALTTISGFIGAAVSFLYGDVTPALYWLIAFMVIDFLTGVMNAVIDKKLNSEVCARGIARKVFIMLLVAVGHGVDVATGINVAQGVVTFFYIASEALSITENAAEMGLPMPQKLIDLLEQLKKDNDKGGE